MDAGTAELLAASLRRALSTESAEAVEKALSDVGWREALQAEGIAAAALLFAEQGAVNAASGALDDVLVGASGLAADSDVGFVLPALGSHSVPAVLAGGSLTLRGLGTARLAGAARAVVAAADGARVVSTHDLRLRPVGGVDPRLGLVRVDGVCLGSSDAVAIDWPHVVAVGQVALAYELIGASRTMLRLAREHALTRIQFGRPIASFQAVRHRLADSLLAIETADAVAAAWSEGAEPLVAAIAKALAGRGARTVARHCQQVLAGVGFTAEHDFHRYLRRVLVLDGLLGDARTLTRELGERLVRTRQMPTAPAL